MAKSNTKKAIIIGSGLSGLAISIRLALKGYNVRIFEAGEGPGGKLNLLELGPYRFDLGPSLFTLPQNVTELYQLAGKDHSDYFSYRKLELSCKYFWEDRTEVMAWTDNQKYAKEIAMKLGVSEKTTLRYIQHTKKLYRLTSPLFMDRSLHKLKSYLSTHTLKPVSYAGNLDIFTTMDKANKKRLGHPKMVQMFNRMATYNGSDPYKAPGILNIITSLEHGDGVYFPENGMYSITTGLVNLAKDLGVEFRFNTKVDKIIHQNKKTKGIIADGTEYYSDVVVSNMDVFLSYRTLLRDINAPEKILAQERSSSALVFYWGIEKSFDELELHNIFFSENYPEEFHYLFDKKDIYHDPTIYVNISSKESPSDAPPGHENWFVMINAPSNNNQNWEEIISRTRRNVIKKLNRILRADIEKYIKEEYIWDPGGIEEKTSSYKGSLYGTSSNSKFAAFLRHPNFSKRLKNLYFVGGSVHPGGGIPLVLKSAKITSEMIGS